MWGEGGLGELASGPLHPRLTDSVNALAFDPAEEALWAGTEGGLVCQLLCPALEPYSAFPAHQVRLAGCWLLGSAQAVCLCGKFCGTASLWLLARLAAAAFPPQPCRRPALLVILPRCPNRPCRQDRVLELRALGEAAVSISPCDLSVHASGGLQRLSWADEVRDFALLFSRRWLLGALLWGMPACLTGASVNSCAFLPAQHGTLHP